MHIVASNTVPVGGLKKAKTDSQKTQTIRTLLLQISGVGLPLPQREQQLVPGRRFACDMVWRDAMLVAEYEGGIMTHGQLDEDGKPKRSRHATPMGFTTDCEKYNELGIEGYIVLRFTAPMVNSGLAVAQIERAYRAFVASGCVVERFEQTANAAIDEFLTRFFGPERGA